jgi:adenylosuccinate synthase
MTCTVVVGGQFGSEGKGKVVSFLARRHADPWVVRCGGPNSGHTTFVDGRDVVLRQVPAGVSNPSASLAIAAGCVVDEELLLREIEVIGLERDRLVIDPRAVLVEQGDRDAEVGASTTIGSTASGTGAALIRRMLRGDGVKFADSSDRLRAKARIEVVAPQVHRAASQNRDVVIEGTQGFGLSLFHGVRYPFVTARDTTAAAFASEVGIGPRQVTDVCVVVRTFPIRVAGNSGPLQDEITWDVVRELGGAPAAFPELTSVTRKIRRVARFDLALVAQACRYNGASALAVMGLDRLDHANTGVTEFAQLSLGARRFLQELSLSTETPVTLVGTGFSTDAILPTPAAGSRMRAPESAVACV